MQLVAVFASPDGDCGGEALLAKMALHKDGARTW
jgi:hypothetical protein